VQRERVEEMLERRMMPTMEILEGMRAKQAGMTRTVPKGLPAEVGAKQLGAGDQKEAASSREEQHGN
jgi:hypothetical protein